MHHSNILCIQCGTAFSYESQRTKPREFCTTNCRNRYRYANDPDYCREAARKSYHKHKKPAEVTTTDATCIHCGEKFSYDKVGKRQQKYCSKACIKAAHYEANKAEYIERARVASQTEEYKAKAAAHYRAHKAVYQAKSAAWREANREVIQAKKKAYQASNRDARKAYYREWVALPGNRERICRNAKDWAKKNPDKVRVHKAIRRRMMREQIVERFDPLEVFERDGWVCKLCNSPVDPDLVWPDRMSKSLDHIIPISKGGVHSRANTQLAHVSCNSSKNDRVQEEQAA